MTRISPSMAGSVQQKLASEADRRGNADGVASKAELAALAKAMAAKPAPVFDETHADRLEKVRTMAADGVELATLDPAMAKLPEPIRRLALELDACWGNADGKISRAELDRVSRYYMSALPFFTDDAKHLLELAQYMKLDDAPVGKPAQGVVALRIALAKVDQKTLDAGKPFRALFDEAVRLSDAPGAPELLREAINHSPKWHSLSVLEHSAMAVEAAVKLAESTGVDWKEGAATMLLHDVGKILERQVRTDGRGDKFSFWDHEVDGATWLKAHGVSEEMFFLVATHSVLRGKSVDEMEALAGSKERLGKMMVVYVADQVAKGGTEAQLQSFKTETPSILACCERAGIDGKALLAEAARLRMEHFGAKVPD